jgi:hypothetical protein
MKNTFLLLAFTFISIQGFSQELPIKVIQKQLAGKNMTVLQSQENIFKIQHKKTKKWGVFYWDSSEEKAEEIIPFAVDSVGWFKEMEPYIIVKNKNKYGLFLNPVEISNAFEKVNFKYDQIKTVEQEGVYYTLVSINNLWGLIDWFDGFTIIPCIYKTSIEVPLIQVESWQVPTIEKATKELKVDLVIFDQNNGDGAFIARNKTTKKWGMFQDLGDRFDEMIPMKYDRVNTIPYNGSFAMVYNQGKVGVYLSKWSYNEQAKETVPCIYDDYYRIRKQGIQYLALKKDNNWGWVDWLTGEEKSEFIYKATEDLTEPNYEQKRWLDN